LESAWRELARFCVAHLGDPQAHTVPGAMAEGQTQYKISGCFVLTPDTQHHMLVGNVGFPAEQARLMIPIDGGHPGWVYTHRQDLLLGDTAQSTTAFKQYLKTSRMGSAMYCPMVSQQQFIGMFVMAAQAKHTLRESDMSVMRLVAHLAVALWHAHGGPAWLAAHHPPENAFRVAAEGLDNSAQASGLKG
jgi:signal transduction protein with GAF and PtsI domain